MSQLNFSLLLEIAERTLKKKLFSPRRGIEPRSGTRQAPILTIKLSRNNEFVFVVAVLSVDASTSF